MKPITPKQKVFLNRLVKSSDARIDVSEITTSYEASQIIRTLIERKNGTKEEIVVEKSIKPVKDMKTVQEYNHEGELKFLRGMCFNNASLLLSSGGSPYIKGIPLVFKLARDLFDEALKQDFLSWR